MIPNEALIDTLVEARLEGLHRDDRHLRHSVPTWAAPPAAGSRAWEARPVTTTAGPSLRVRIGHGLLALGASIAGEDAQDREAQGQAAPNHAQRPA